MQIYTEITPNPESMKFVLEKTLVNDTVYDFTSIEEARDISPLAEDLFQFSFTKGVFLGRNFITLTKENNSIWEDIIPKIKDSIREFISTGKEIVLQEGTITGPNENIKQHDAISEEIAQIIEEQVRPAVAMDGGDIIFESFEEGIVKLRLRGSCSGCPSSMVTLKHGIESLLKRLFPDVVQSVEAI